MDRHFQECFTSRLTDTGNVFPFFWQHGETREQLKEEMDAIRRDGSTEFCVESRPHEKFCEDEWWDDFGFMLEYARQNGMRVWLLDDKHFPTGYANRYVDSHPELRRVLLRLDYRDVTGPVPGGAILPPTLDKNYEESFVSVTAWKRADDFRTVIGKPVDLTDRIDGAGRIPWDIPEGTWRIYYAIRTLKTHSTRQAMYIDMLNPDSTAAMIHAVYQPHYEHFKEYFGNTFRGFFSDEPTFANGTNSYEATVGTEDLLMPWRPDLPERIGKEIGKDAEYVRLRLPALWHNLPKGGAAVRCGYMDQITKLYRDNFCQMLGDWCRERKVEYIGHIIEDMNTHQRLGFGAGHYFRSLWGQDMSGIDIVLNQMVPRNTEIPHTGPVCGKVLDPAFFNYMLGKLGASGAHIQPEKQNRAMAEVFGAFGWAEGVGYMKYLADQFLACGINQFVPHAYSPKYPDPDCPPHFHAQGKNPQEPAFGMLIRYMQKVSRLCADSVHKADVAVFYNAEAEWCGGKCEFAQETCRRLTREQIDFDLLPEDILYDAEVENHRLKVNEETYGALIVPYCQILPEKILRAFARLKKRGLPVIYEEKAPARTAFGTPAKTVLGDALTVVPAKEITGYLRKRGFSHLSLTPACPGLRVYECDRDGEQIVLLFNEGAAAVDARLKLDGGSDPVFYDVWNNVIRKPDVNPRGIRVKLASGQAVALLCGSGKDAPAYDYRDRNGKKIAPVWEISLNDAGTDGFRNYGKTADYPRFNTAGNEPDFCGTIRYESTFAAKGTETALDLGYVGEIATVTVNGKNCGTAVSAPYVFDVSKALKAGRNEIRVDVVNNLAYRDPDRFSTYVPLPVTGLTEPFTLL